MFTTLVIGYGSIGERHANIISKFDDVTNVVVLSARKNLPFKTITSIEDVPDLNPDYIIISSETKDHYWQLKFLEEHLYNKIILIEKPLFACKKELSILKNKVFVAYNLRFHPLFEIVKEFLSNKKIWFSSIQCCSYLPDWRKNRDYRKSYSAIKSLGGGVLLDLSHELDYAQWIFGLLKVEFAIIKKLSNLEIDTDDFLLLNARNEGDVCVQINLNYFTRKAIRKILIDGHNISIQGDLINNILDIFVDGKNFKYEWPGLDNNYTYLSQHRAILDGNYSKVCTYEEGFQTMTLIDQINDFR